MDPRFPPPAPSSTGFSGGFPTPARGHHHRAHSETFIRLPDADLLLDVDVDADADFGGFSDLDCFPSLSDDSPAASDPTLTPQAPPPPQPHQQAAAGAAGAASPAPPPRPPSGAHMRSLSLDAAFFDGLSLQGGSGGGGGAVAGHKRSGSTDGSKAGESATSSAVLLPDYAKKAVPDDRLAELALLDSKRAKRCRRPQARRALLTAISSVNLAFYALVAAKYSYRRTAADDDDTVDR